VRRAHGIGPIRRVVRVTSCGAWSSPQATVTWT
jgi:hypothetical protein